MICNNRDKCNNQSCGHRFSHSVHLTWKGKSEYVDCDKSNCGGNRCTANCGTPRKCVPEFIDLVKNAVKEGE